MWKRLLVCTALAASAASHGAEVIGYVLAVDGQWFAGSSSEPLVVGAPVEAGSTLSVRSASSSDRIIVLAARSGAVLAARNCSEADACKEALTLPATVTTRRTGANWSGTLDKVLARVAGEPDRYVSNLSRRSMLLRDAVLKWDQGRADFGPLFGTLPSGSYEVVLSKFNCSSSKPCAPMPLSFRFQWAPGSGLTPAVAGLEPGLYDMSARSEGKTADPVQARSWLLLVPAAELVSTAQRYSAALSLVDSWGPQVDSATKRSFARATLDALSER